MFEIKHDQKTSVLNDQTLVIQHNQDEESGEQGTSVTCEFAFITWHHTWRPSVTDKLHTDGAQIAIVTGPPGVFDASGPVQINGQDSAEKQQSD